MTYDPAYYSWSRPEIASLLPKEYLRVLEIGCGDGRFREHLRTDCEYWGVEPTSSAAKSAADRLDRVLVGTYDEIASLLPARHFDLVICNDVIEHMTDHESFLTSIRSKLADSAVLVGSIPNVRYLANIAALLLKKDWQYQDGGGILDRTHLRFFTEKSLRRTFDKCRFSIDVFQRVNPLWKRASRLKGAMNFAVACPFALVLGFDVMYVQFGFRVRALT